MPANPGIWSAVASQQLLAGLRPSACRQLTCSRADQLSSHVQGASPMSGRSRGTAAGQAPLTPVQLTPTSQDTPPSPEQQQFLQSLGRQEQQVGGLPGSLLSHMFYICQIQPEQQAINSLPLCHCLEVKCSPSACTWKIACSCCCRMPSSKQRRVRAAALPIHPLHA